MTNKTVEAGFSTDQLPDFTLRKEILFDSHDKIEVSRREGEFIRALKSNDALVGYNRAHRSRNDR